MKLTDSQLLEYRMDLEKLIIKKEGMLAKNNARIFQRQSLAYDEDSFQILAAQIQQLHDNMIHIMDK